MKKSITITAVLTLVIFTISLITSCGKKTTEPDNMASTVTMTYTPNPATVNTSISFNFSVMENMVAVDVTDVTCAMMMGMTALNPMTVTKTGTGMFMGTATFTKSDSCKITLNYNHHGTMMMQDFMIFVK